MLIITTLSLNMVILMYWETVLMNH